MEVSHDTLVVIPKNLRVPKDLPYEVHRMEFLSEISVISSRGYNMNLQLQTSNKDAGLIAFLKGKLGLMVKEDEHLPPGQGKEVFYRHIRIINDKTGEFYHNVGATVLIDLRADEGRFFFSFSVCNYQDNFNKHTAHTICKDRMTSGQVFEVINYDPSLSVLQNIYLAIGVVNGQYPTTDYDWEDILPEFYGTFTDEQKATLMTLRKLIRKMAQN